MAKKSALPATSGALVLAAGKGTRMHSERPKVLHTLLGEPMLGYVFSALSPLFGARVWSVVGHRAADVRAAFPEMDESLFVLQEPQLGTGHALMAALPALRAAGLTHCLVVNGDTPLLAATHVQSFLDAARGADLAFLSLYLADAGSFGRVLRDEGGRVRGVVEAKDWVRQGRGADPGGEINAGVYWLNLDAAAPLLDQLSADNAAGEYYITDLVALAVGKGLAVAAVSAGDDPRLLGVNSPAELARSEEALRAAIVEGLLGSGVMLHRPELVSVGPRARVAPGAELFGPCEVLGASSLEPGAVVQPFCVLRDSLVQEGSEVRSFSHLDGAVLGQGCVAGPYARLRPGAVLRAGARVGNFVEMKQAVLGEGAKANHLSYLGDAEVGAGANVGAGTITCNYDGKKKHKTVIGERAFIGSNTALVAPVTVGEEALVGAGSVITRDVAPGRLALTRAEQRDLPRRGK